MEHLACDALLLGKSNLPAVQVVTEFLELHDGQVHLQKLQQTTKTAVNDALALMKARATDKPRKVLLVYYCGAVQIVDGELCLGAVSQAPISLKDIMDQLSYIQTDNGIDKHITIVLLDLEDSIMYGLGQWLGPGTTDMVLAIATNTHGLFSGLLVKCLEMLPEESIQTTLSRIGNALSIKTKGMLRWSASMGSMLSLKTMNVWSCIPKDVVQDLAAKVIKDADERNK